MRENRVDSPYLFFIASLVESVPLDNPKSFHGFEPQSCLHALELFSGHDWFGSKSIVCFGDCHQ